MLEILSGRPMPRLKMDDRRMAVMLSGTVSDKLRTEEPFLVNVADEVDKILAARAGEPFARLSYDGSAPVEIPSSLRFAEIELALPVEEDTLILLVDMVQAAFIKTTWTLFVRPQEAASTELSYDHSVTLCLHNPSAHTLTVGLDGLLGCVAEQNEVDVPAGAFVELNLYFTPDWRLYVAASTPMYWIDTLSSDTL